MKVEGRSGSQDVICEGEPKSASAHCHCGCARAGCPWPRRPQRRVLRAPLLPRWVLAPPAFPSGCAVPQGPPPSTWRARSGRASCESATPRRSRRRGSCSHPVILYLFPKRAKTSVRIRKRDHRRSRLLCWASRNPARRRAMRILVSWYPVRPYAHIRLYTRSHLSVSVAPRAASPAGAPPGGACRRPDLPSVYTIFDLSVTKG